MSSRWGSMTEAASHQESESCVWWCPRAWRARVRKNHDEDPLRSKTTFRAGESLWGQLPRAESTSSSLTVVVST